MASPRPYHRKVEDGLNKVYGVYVDLPDGTYELGYIKYFTILMSHFATATPRTGNDDLGDFLGDFGRAFQAIVDYYPNGEMDWANQALKVSNA